MVLLLAAILLFAGSVRAGQGLEVRDARIGIHPDKTRFVISLSDAADFRAFVLPDPYRVVIDLPRAGWSAGGSFKPDGGVKALRQGALDNNTTRLELETQSPMVITEAFVMTGPDRVVVDFKPAAAAEFKAAQGTTFGRLLTQTAEMKLPGVATPPRKPEVAMAPEGLKMPPVKPATQKRIIALDAGHGGDDPGALGPGGLKEKNITLAFVKELKSALEDSGRYKVVLTRSSDKYLKLYQRVDIARAAGAQLFVSIHADSANHDARGASIYTLSEKASDSETARLAERENRVDAISGIDLSHEEAEVASILIDLAMRDTMNESNFFANILVNAFKGGGIRTLPNTHRSAGFAVLKAPDIPSVLIELGFITNPAEARLLNSPDHRRTQAGAIMKGIDSYFARLEALQRS